MRGFSQNQIKQLAAKLDRAHVQSRSIDGRPLDYIEGWFAISEANAIFGFGGWDREMVHFERVFEQNRFGETVCGYLARVRVTVRTAGSSVVREGTGFGTVIAKERGDAHDRALKVAETDATKRAFVTFGNRFGLALYDKEKNGITGAMSAVVGRPSTKTADRLEDTSDAEHGGQQVGNFVLRDGTGETIARGLSGEGFCTGLRQIIEGHEKADELEQLKYHNSEMLRLLRRQNPALTSKRGVHYSDILEQLIATKQERLMTTMLPRTVLDDVSDPTNKIMQESLSGVEIVNGVPAAAFPEPNGNATQAVILGPNLEARPDISDSAMTNGSGHINKNHLLIPTERRVRNKAHLHYVSSKPCLICNELPCHAHHITFAQPRGLSIKVSDEFTVPLCVVHHNLLHGTHDERAFWQRNGIDPLDVASNLWLMTQTGIQDADPAA